MFESSGPDTDGVEALLTDRGVPLSMIEDFVMLFVGIRLGTAVTGTTSVMICDEPSLRLERDSEEVEPFLGVVSKAFYGFSFWSTNFIVRDGEKIV